MPTIKPVIELVKIPVLVPSVVLVDKLTVGAVLVLQQTPLAVIVPPPSLVTFPPPEAVVLVIEVIEVVVRTGAEGNVVVKLCSSPYDVPTLLVAYART